MDGGKNRGQQKEGSATIRPTNKERIKKEKQYLKKNTAFKPRTGSITGKKKKTGEQKMMEP